jgi:hypothetical protein
MFAWISLSKHPVLLRIAATRACAARQRWPGRSRAAPARRGVTEAPSGRERRARIIGADGEYQASKLAQAASVMAADPAALPLQLLPTTVEVAAEKNSRVVIVPVPVEVLRFLDRAASGAWPGQRSAGEARPQPVVQAGAGQHENANRQSTQSALS